MIQKEKDILLACDIAWQEKFLEVTGYKIGDEVYCLFDSDFGTSKECHGSCEYGKGVIMRMDDGSIKIKSNEMYLHGRSVRRYPDSPVRFQCYWKYEKDFDYADLKSMLGVKQTDE